MEKKGKLSTPDWIKEGYNSPAEYAKANGIKTEKKKANSGRLKKIKVCPKCGSNNVGVTLSNLDSEEESNTGKQWECRKCGWKGMDIKEKELSEDEFLALGEKEK